MRISNNVIPNVVTSTPAVATVRATTQAGASAGHDVGQEHTIYFATDGIKALFTKTSTVTTIIDSAVNPSFTGLPWTRSGQSSIVQAFSECTDLDWMERL